MSDKKTLAIKYRSMADKMLDNATKFIGEKPFGSEDLNARATMNALNAAMHYYELALKSEGHLPL